MNIFIDVVIIPLGVLVIYFLAGFSWLVEEPSNGLVADTFMLLILYAFFYEAGYKKILKQSNMKKYFYIVFVFPVVAATIGFFMRLVMFDGQ